MNNAATKRQEIIEEAHRIVGDRGNACDCEPGGKRFPLCYNLDELRSDPRFTPERSTSHT